MVLIVEMNEFLEVFGVDVFNRFSIVVYIVNVGQDKFELIVIHVVRVHLCFEIYYFN